MRSNQQRKAAESGDVSFCPEDGCWCCSWVAIFVTRETLLPVALCERGDVKLGLMVKCTPERGQKCSLFYLMVKCTPIIVELPSVYRGCKPLICFQ